MGKHIFIREARCSFPRLYGTEVNDSGTFGPGITLVLEREKHAAVLTEIRTEIKAAIAGNKKLSDNPPSGDRICLRVPERDELKYLSDNLVIKANCQRAPTVLEPDGRTVMTQATDKIYSGCYVNAKIEIWGQANKFGRRVNAKLVAVQYVPRDAESFDGSYVSPEEAARGFEPQVGNDPVNDSVLDESGGLLD